MSRLLVAVLALATAYVASLVVLPIEKVEVVGTAHLTKPEVQRLTGLYPGESWLWATSFKLRALRADPWVKAARIERPALGVVRVVVTERVPVATLVRGKEERLGLAGDGTVLPGAPRVGPEIQGFGPDRTREALEIVRLFPDATSIHYTPAGFSVNWQGRKLWAPDARSLRAVADRARMSASTEYYAYTWGVSLRR
ncbi:FtsQ-type POTRA domain-containing protein [Marinithermus hydrothermalis]|uniref:Polypeptide-transport-associated domain protein FtsQ-type n=1 Tax=Marinithermus hydrothermalis (strain DSM 14884 / JCM 11576 / T1) TaxID=869210 RepID=F2NML7_MARHT|nr:FtsQ-type POTRA domain-containing protein [Marinithermus hydrothermalis]AEB12187.1 Polypeptide-transport-associated domain protein FtsQ-type [Marinithermus hydrothermalis DSM 14884]